MLVWGKYRNLENSLKDFLDAQIISDSIIGENGNSIPVIVGRKNSKNWTLPCISLYVDAETLERFELGSNLRDERELLIIDIYASNEGERLDLANWLNISLNNGWRYYTYAENPSDRENPIKTTGGLVNVNFLTNSRVNLGQNVSEVDSHRHRITINVWISG